MTTPTPPAVAPNETGLVAVVGLGCVLPDAHNVQDFWNNIRSGRNSIREVPKDRWDPDLYYSPDRSDPDKTYAKIGAFVRDFRFDGMKFRIPPTVLKSLDASQLWALEAAQQALADAGYDKKEFDRSRCAVILGNAMGGETRIATSIRVAYPLMRKALSESPDFRTLPAVQQRRVLEEAEGRFKANFPEITEDTMPGELSNVIAGRIANVLNLSGKNFTTDAACASSLAAIDAAVKSLQAGEVDLVLTGGVDRSMDVATYVKFCKIGALSANGSFPFDARADGFVMGEGAAILLLKRLEDAQRDGDRIYGVLRGVGSSSDGKGKGITAPNLDGQLKCVRRALEDAQLTAGDVDLVECHGTSTKVGDVVEIQGLTQIFGPHVAKKQSIPIGSVKSNIGHLKSAAGAASIIKVLLALHHKSLPPSINFQAPNPNLRLEETPFYVITESRPWPEPAASRPRRAGISSFGFGGTNFHVVVEEYSPGKNVPKALARAAPVPSGVAPSGVSSVLLKAAPRHRTLEPLAPAARTDVLVVGARSRPQAEPEIRRVEAELSSLEPASFHSYLAQRNRDAVQQPLRVALVVESPQDAIAKLAQVREALADPRKFPLLAPKGIYVGEGNLSGKVAFLFPGQGSQYADMLRDLQTRFEAVKRTVEDADRVMEPLVGSPLTQFLFSDEAAGRRREQVEEALKRTEITQPAVLTADTALFRLLAEYGVRPELVAGHSLGEYGALIAAGVLTFEDAVLAVSARGREMAAVKVPDLGKMASVTADPATVEAKLKGIGGYVIPANKNCKVQTVIAGASPAVDAAVRMFNAEGIQAQHIPVSAAFHSAIVAPATEPLKRVVERLDVREPKIPILSNVHADYYPKGPGAREAAIDLLGRQVASPVEWQRQVERMYQDGARVFVEVGPKSVLTTFVRNILEGRPHSAVATNHPKRGGFYHYFDALAVLAAAGYPLRFPDPADANVHLPAFAQNVRPWTPASQAAPPAQKGPAAVPVSVQESADEFIRQKQEELRQALLAQFRAAAPAPAAVGPADEELLALKRRVESLGLNLEPVLITGVSVGTPGTFKRLFDDTNIERILAGENAIEPLSADELRKQVDKNIVRLVKSESGDHRFEAINDVSEVIKLAAKKGRFDLERDYGLASDFVAALDITSKMAIAAGIEALRDAQIPLVRGYVKTTTGKFLPGEWALPEPLQAETGIIFASAFPGMSNLTEQLSRYLAYRYGQRPYRELARLYNELIDQVQEPAARATLERWYREHEGEIRSATSADVFQFSRRFLVQVLSMGHSQLAQLIRAKGPNTQINAACASTTQGVGLAEDWIRTGRCKRVLVVGADDITNEGMLDVWAAGFLAAGAATTKADVREAALPFDKRRHGMIIGSGAVGIVIEAESLVKQRGMDGIAEVLATMTANSAYHITRLDTDDIARLMDELVATVERRTGVPRSAIADRLLFMSHETYTPARGGSAAAEIAALTKTFGRDVHKVVVANTKGFTGHPQGASIEDAIAVRCLQLGRVPPIANLREPDPSLGNIRLSQGGAYDIEYGLRLAAGFGNQVAMFVMKLRNKDSKRILDPSRYSAWVGRISGSKNPELEVVNRTLRVKASMPVLSEPVPTAPKPAAAPSPPAAPAPAPAPMPTPANVTREQVLQRVIDVVAEKTGYTKDMLDPNLELEADLGIDTVKQAELFGLFRATYGLPRDETLQLKDYPTLQKITDYIHGRLPAPTAHAAAPPAVAPPPPPPAVAPKADAGREQVVKRLVALVAEKTGYPPEMLEPDLELEADLGIDTVKQAEILGLVRQELGVARDDSVQIKDLNTLNKIVDYFLARASPAVAPSAPPVPAPLPTPPAEAIASAPAVAFPAASDRAAVLEKVRSLVAERTGYPLELLEPDLDLEADLGIDTVKQAEMFGVIRDSYGIARVEGVQLKDYNTLNRLVDFILQGPGGPSPVPPTSPAPAAAPPAPVEPPRATAPPPKAAAGTTEILDKVRQLVADKTGYPLELLEPDLDLEADLGIDTVKQAEMFGVIRDSYGIARVEGVQLKDYNTLNKLAGFIQLQLQTPPLAPPVVEAAPQAPTVLTVEVPPAQRESHRYLVRYVRLETPPSDPTILQGKTLVIWAPPQYRADLGHALRNAGATAVALDALPAKYDEAQDWVDAQRRKTPRLSGLVFVPVPNPTGSAFEAGEARLPKALFYLVKALLKGAKSGEVEVVAAATFLGGDFCLQTAQPLNPLEGALAGLVKAVSRELPGAVSKAVDFPHGVAPPTLARALVDELGRRDGIVEVGTFGGRGTLKLLEQETVEEEPGIDLGPNDVIVVSGGGAGITSDVVQRLARGAPAGFVLLGRTGLHSEAARYAGFTEQEWNGKRVEIQSEMRARGEKVTPVAVDRRLNALRKSAEIHNTLEALHRAGARAEYHTVDVTDAKAVASLLKVVRTTLGPITGIVHAAGVEESKLIVDKTSESFDRVFDVKVLGARALLEATSVDSLRFFLAFTSIAGRFGNAGQADYSAANDCLVKLCAALRQERGRSFPATAMDWTAWADKGMATRGSVMTVLREAGVTPLALAEGVERVASELGHGCQEAEVVIAGELGRLAPPGSFTGAGEPAPPPPRTVPATAVQPTPPQSGAQQVLTLEAPPASAEGGDALLEGAVTSDGRTATATFTLDPQRDPYLRDHAIDGVPYLPGVFGQEAFAEVARRLAHGYVYVGARDVEFRLPAKVLRERPLEVTVVASIAHETDDRIEIGCRLQSLFVNARGERMGAPRIHFTATLLFEKNPPQAPAGPGAGGDLEAIVEKREIYKFFFHGPSFQVLDRVGFSADGQTAIGLWSDPRAPLFPNREQRRMLTNPMMRELAYQTAGAFELFKHRHLSLPKAEGRLVFYKDAAASTAVRAWARLKEVRGDTAHFDVLAASVDDNTTLFEIRDFQLIRLRPLEPTNGGGSPTTSTPVYRARWGQDLPLPLTDAVGVLVRQPDLERAQVTQDETLTSGERADQLRYRNEQRAREFFAGRLAAKEAIARLLNRPLKEARGIEIRRLETGEPQPRGSGLEDVVVSITHTGQEAIAVAARRSLKLRTVGIDAERIEPKPGAFETEAFAEPERALVGRLVAAGQDRAEVLVRFWAVKEAVLKALGKGFALDLHDVQVRDLEPGEGARVELLEPARKVLWEIGAQRWRVQTWIREGVAYALCWTQP